MAKEWQDHFGVECRNCGKLFDYHRAVDNACPNSRYNKLHGGYNENSHFE